MREAAADGLLGGHPVVDVRVVLVDGATHTNDSSELAFQIAGSLAFRAAAAEAEPCLLEPVMRLEVTCPEDATSARWSATSARRGGQVLGLDVREATATAWCAPRCRSRETFGYAGALERADPRARPVHARAAALRASAGRAGSRGRGGMSGTGLVSDHQAGFLCAVPRVAGSVGVARIAGRHGLDDAPVDDARRLAQELVGLRVGERVAQDLVHVLDRDHRELRRARPRGRP